MLRATRTLQRVGHRQEIQGGGTVLYLASRERDHRMLGGTGGL